MTFARMLAHWNPATIAPAWVDRSRPTTLGARVMYPSVVMSGNVTISPADDAPGLLHGKALILHPVKLITTTPELGAVISPLFVSPVHFSCVLPVVSRSVGPLFDRNGFGNGPDHSGSADADDATAALIASVVMRQSAPACRRVIAHAPFRCGSAWPTPDHRS